MLDAKVVADEIRAIYRGKISNGVNLYLPLEPLMPEDGTPVHTVSSGVAKELYRLANEIAQRESHIPRAKKPEEVPALTYRSHRLMLLMKQVMNLFWIEVEAEMGPVPGMPRFEIRQDWRVVLERERCPDCGQIHPSLEDTLGPGEFRLMIPTDRGTALPHLNRNGKNGHHTTTTAHGLEDPGSE